MPISFVIYSILCLYILFFRFHDGPCSPVMAMLPCIRL